MCHQEKLDGSQKTKNLDDLSVSIDFDNLVRSDGGGRVMRMDNTRDDQIAMHWLERLHINLSGMSEDARNTVFALLHSPWECSQEAILQHVPAPLNTVILLLKRSVQRHVFGKRARLSVRAVIDGFWLNASVYDADGSAVDLPSNTVVARDAYVGVAKEDLAKANKVSATGRFAWDQLSDQAKGAVLALYATCDLAVHVMAGMFTRFDDDHSIRYVVDSRWHLAKRIRWFSLYWAQQSTSADAHTAQQIWALLPLVRDPVRYTELFEAWVDSLLDKYLCLHRKYIPQLLRTKNGSAVNTLRSRAELICFVWLQSLANGRENLLKAILAGQPIGVVSYGRLEEAGFNASEVDELLAESMAEGPGDQFVTPGDAPGTLNIQNMLLKYAFQKYVRPKLLLIGSPLGKWFEKEYVQRYLQERLDHSRFLVWTGINDEDAKYDADVIIYDKASDIFYFCQIKHRSEVLQPYLRDELDEFSRNKQIRHGCEQLIELRSRIDTPDVRSKLVSRAGKKLVDKALLSERSRFLLIHTVENLDMCTNDGISMYEWNTFRNLLQGRMSLIRNETDGELPYETQKLDFSDIEAVQTHLMNVLERFVEGTPSGQPTPRDMYDLLQQAELSLKYRIGLWLNDWPVLQTGIGFLRTPLL